MREIQASTITDVVEKLCIEANYHLPEDVKCAITAGIFIGAGVIWAILVFMILPALGYNI